MYARLVLFNTRVGQNVEVEKVAVEMAPKVMAHKGFKSLNFMENLEKDEYGFYIIWETEKDAEEAKEALLPLLKKKLEGISKGPIVVKLFEVVQP